MEDIFNCAKDSKRPKSPSEDKGLELDRTGLGREQGPAREGGGSVYWQKREHVWLTFIKNQVHIIRLCTHLNVFDEVRPYVSRHCVQL